MKDLVDVLHHPSTVKNHLTAQSLRKVGVKDCWIIAVFWAMRREEVMVVRQGIGLAIIQLALGLRKVIPHLVQAYAIAGTSMCSFVVNCERSVTHVKEFRVRIQII
jgi:hypothetical protein